MAEAPPGTLAPAGRHCLGPAAPFHPPTHPTTPHQLSWLYAPSFWPSGFGGLLWYWLRELSLGLVPWTTLLAVSIPLPLKHGV